MTGSEIRLGRLLREGNAVVVAADHGEFAGPVQGLTDVPGVVESLSEADGILLSPGMVRHCAATFMKRDRPLLAVRLNWGSNFAMQWDYNDAHHALVVPPEDALALGADMGLASCILKTGSERTDTETVGLFSEIIRAKRACGLPVVGEYYPARRESLSAEQLHEQVAIACRVMCELGADAVKTCYTGKKFREIVAATPIPVFALGADKTEREIDALRLAYDAVNDGARGVFFGRNVFQAGDPPRFLQALKKVVKQGADPSAAAGEFGLA
jgi:class I fructose-bisphosphate aldolase